MRGGFEKERSELNALTAAATSTRLTPPLIDSVNCLDGEVCRLGTLLSELSVRLESVLLPSSPSPVDEQKPEPVPMLCPLEVELNSIRRSVEGLSRVVIDLDARLRL